MSLRCLFSPCVWHYIGAFDQNDPSVGPTGTQGQRGIYQCLHCKTVSMGSPIDPQYRKDEFKGDAPYGVRS